MPEKKVRMVYQSPSIPRLYNQVGIYARVSTCSPEQMNSLAAQFSELVRMFRADYTARIYDVYIDTGFAMPEFPGYNGRASHECWLIRVKAVTHRKNPIMQTCIGPSEEHVNMAGLPTEASIFSLIDRALPGKVLNVYAHRAGGGKYMAILQCKKTVHTDEGKQRQAALLAFSAFPELKHVILVDEDVDIFDTNDVLWAMNTRFQGDRDIITIPGVRCHPLDPSSNPEYSPSIRDVGISCKTIFDCTVPFDLKDKFIRAPFMELDPEKWLRG